MPLTQLGRGDERIAIRIVIALGDIAVQDGDFMGEAFALATRIEAVTPPDEIYLTAAARLALTSAAEIQTALVETFVFKGFADATPIYRVQQRHRTRTIADTYILHLDLIGFGKIMDADPGGTTVEQLLDVLDTVTNKTTLEFDGTIRFNLGDSYCVTFADAGQAIAGAERLSRSWAAKQQELFGCAISIGLVAMSGSPRDCRMRRPSSWKAAKTVFLSPVRFATHCSVPHGTTDFMQLS